MYIFRKAGKMCARNHHFQHSKRILVTQRNRNMKGFYKAKSSKQQWDSCSEQLIEQSCSTALDNSSAPTTVTLKSNQSLLFAFQAAHGWHCLKITILPPLSCLINKSDVQFRNFAINLLKYCWRMLIVMPVAIKAHLHNLCEKQLQVAFADAAHKLLPVTCESTTKKLDSFHGKNICPFVSFFFKSHT